MTEALVSGPVGVVLGFLLSYMQAHYSAKKAAREQLLTQMQQLVIAVADLGRARAEYDAAHVGTRPRMRTLFLAASEWAGTWSSQGRTWNAATSGLAPVVRTVYDWDRGTLLGAREVTLAMSRVAAAGLALGMSENAAVAEAAQRLMDAALQDEGETAVDNAVRQLRVSLYPAEVARTR